MKLNTKSKRFMKITLFFIIWFQGIDKNIKMQLNMFSIIVKSPPNEYECI
jgi:hypothetical protein